MVEVPKELMVGVGAMVVPVANVDCFPMGYIAHYADHACLGHGRPTVVEIGAGVIGLGERRVCKRRWLLYCLVLLVGS